MIPTHDEIKAMITLQMLGNGDHYLCDKCNEPLLGAGYSMDEWLAAGNRYSLCAKCEHEKSGNEGAVQPRPHMSSHLYQK